MFLDKKQGWCYIIVIVVSQGVTRKVERRRKVVRLRNVNVSESRNSFSFGYDDKYKFFRLG